MTCPRALWFGLFAVVQASSLPAQMVVTLTAPTNQSHFSKAAGMQLNIPLNASVANPGPGTTWVNFYADGVYVGAGSSRNGYSLVWSNVSLGTHILRAGYGDPSSDPVTIFVEAEGVALVSEQTVWRYLDGGADPGPTWFLPEAELSVWPSGVPQFGFGEQDEQTFVNWLNPSEGSVYPAYYFHCAFLVTNGASYTNVVARLLRDDGAIVYLNGRELFRDNMPSGPVNRTTYASAGALDENVFTDHWLDPSLLVEGINHIAVEIHNQGPASHDISFDLRLVANLAVPPPSVTLRRAGSKVILQWPSSYLGYRLETATLLGTNGWESVTNVVRSAKEFRSTNSISGSAQFFRLSL